MNTPNAIDRYIAVLPDKSREMAEQLRSTIKKAAPEAEEVISYGMPAYKLNGILLYFAVHKNHIGFYPMTAAIEAFKSELTEYKCSKGTIQFPHDKPIPFDLIEKIVKFRVNENLQKSRISSGPIVVTFLQNALHPTVPPSYSPAA
jgi:uncharacterized protein YdhG (YjbR/CyaY superfamily)